MIRSLLAPCTLALLVLASLTATAQEPATAPPQDPQPNEPKTTPIKPAELGDLATEKSTLQKASFLFGYNLVLNLKQQGIEVDPKEVMAGITAAIKDDPIGMDAEEIQSVMVALQKIARKAQQAKQEAMAKRNQAEGEAFIARFSKEEGVKQLEEGIYYKSMTQGDGPQPTPADKVKIHYEGKFVNGEVFDSSLNGDPLELGVSDFVEGFSKALQGMHVGDKWVVAIRGDRAYGMNPPPGFELNKTIIFQIELLDIVK